MFVQAVTLASVRNYPKVSAEFSPGLNLLYGDNAAGKTNLLEAVFYAASLRSFRGAKVRDIVSWGAEEGRVTATAVPIGGGRMHSLSVSVGGTGRRISLDGKRPESVSEYLLILKPSGFSPEDLFLVREFPSHRRRFVDRSVFHIEPGYITLANKYRQAVSQINASLKSGDEKVVAAYEELMAPLAARIVLKRAAYLNRLADKAADIFRKVLAKGGQGGLGIEYRGGPPSVGPAAADEVGEAGEGEGGAVDRVAAENASTYYLEKLRSKRAESIKRGYTPVGPHTEDIVLTLDGRDIKTSASRGQGRLAYLAMVLADAALYHGQTGKHPVMLLDDVVSELDDTRTGALMDYVSGMGQAIITATDDRFLSGRECRRFRVEDGRVTKVAG